MNGIEIPKKDECKFKYFVAKSETCYKCHSPMIKQIENFGERFKSNFALICCINPECDNH